MAYSWCISLLSCLASVYWKCIFFPRKRLKYSRKSSIGVAIIDNNGYITTYYGKSEICVILNFSWNNMYAFVQLTVKSFNWKYILSQVFFYHFYKMHLFSFYWNIFTNIFQNYYSILPIQWNIGTKRIIHIK